MWDYSVSKLTCRSHLSGLLLPLLGKILTSTGENKNKIEQAFIHSTYSDVVGIAMKELFAQFLIVRTYGEIGGCIRYLF